MAGAGVFCVVMAVLLVAHLTDAGVRVARSPQFGGGGFSQASAQAQAGGGGFGPPLPPRFAGRSYFGGNGFSGGGGFGGGGFDGGGGFGGRGFDGGGGFGSGPGGFGQGGFHRPGGFGGQPGGGSISISKSITISRGGVAQSSAGSSASGK